MKHRREILFFACILACAALGAAVGHFWLQHAPSLGANFITAKEVAGAYFGGFMLGGAVGFRIGLEILK